MKRLLFVLVALALSAQLTLAASSGFSLELSKQTPYPAEPGKIIKIEVELTNTGFDDQNSIVIEIVPESPFKLVPGEEAIKTFSRLSAGDSIKISYNIGIDSSAVTNDYEIKFKVYKSGSTVSSEEKIRVAVQGIPNLILDNVKTNPEIIEPTGIFDVMIPIRNVGTGTARQLNAALYPDSESLVPILSGGSYFVGDIQPGFTKYAVMRLKVDSSAEYKTYQTTLTVSYRDESNSELSKSFTIGIPVTGSIQLDLIKTEIDYAKQIIKFNIANKGTTDAKSLEAELFVGNQTIGIDYASQLKANKDTVFEFPAVYNNRGKLVINYIGPGVERNVVEKEVVLNFLEPKQDNSGTIIIAVIVIVVVFYFWRRRKKNRAKSK